MLADICVESQLRDLLEQGFEVCPRAGCHGWPAAPRMRIRIRRGAHQLQIARARGAEHGRAGSTVALGRLIRQPSSRSASGRLEAPPDIWGIGGGGLEFTTA